MSYMDDLYKEDEGPFYRLIKEGVIEPEQDNDE